MGLTAFNRARRLKEEAVKHDKTVETVNKEKASTEVETEKSEDAPKAEKKKKGK